MSSADLSTGEALVGLLEAYGVDTVFGIPGVHNVEMYRALPRSKITHILPRHEQGAGFMADGYARATGRPGVCFTITGPGLLNILTPMAQAWSDSTPLLVISSSLDIASGAQGRGRLHEMQNQRQAAASIVSRATTAFTADDVCDAVALAFAGFRCERPRPAYIELPIDLLSKPAGSGWKVRSLPERPQAGQAQIREAASLLTAARQPLLVLGGGAMEAGVPALVIAEALGAPMLTTVAGKGIVPADHPLCLDARLSLAPVKKLLAAADVVLIAGSEVSETDLWELDFKLSGKVVRIDLDPQTLARPHAPAVAILADAAPTLSAIAAELAAVDAAARRASNLDFIASYLRREARADDESRRDMRRLLAIIREALPGDAIVASDMTQIAYVANQIFPMEKPRTWLHPAGFGTLGFALPAAIGAKVALPARPVAALAGDYGFQYTLNELGTVVELRQSLPILLWNNQSLGAIRDDMIEKRIQPNAVSVRNPDFQALARAYGAKAEKPRSLRELKASILRALEADAPTLIEMTPNLPD
jgi:5-guanidino-2-oxopentanoate decarboxylase